MASIVSDLSDLLGDTLTAQAGSVDFEGVWTPSGSALNLACHLSGDVRMIRDATGQEVVSSVRAVVDTGSALTVDGFRYTLPAGYDPRTDLKAIAVTKARDEDGAHHEVVHFP